jgi:hypothetical protein
MQAAQRKNSKLELKVIFKILKFISFFSHKNAFFGNKSIPKSCGDGVGRGGREVVIKHAGPWTYTSEFT